VSAPRLGHNVDEGRITADLSGSGRPGGESGQRGITINQKGEHNGLRNTNFESENNGPNTDEAGVHSRTLSHSA